jgi:threonine synthase
MEQKPFFSNLKCRECGRLYPKQAIHVCEFDFGPLEAAYDYAEIAIVSCFQSTMNRPLERKSASPRW